MFVFSIKASTIKIATVICASVIALIVLLTMIPVTEPTAASLMYSPVSSYSFVNVKTNEDRINFLKQFGWEVESEPSENVKVTIPTKFDKIFVGYNELQKQQGLDLGKYKGKDVERYTYKITNFDNYNGTVYANIIVYRGKVIGGDICSADLNGFVMTLDGTVKLP
ncbi:MAG: DUF4830 domain-containing protein [Ruminococcaceae bacterium]|nr:DUF4830 domain-containing protein [Oscillospiraceae bacterium]